MLERLLYYLVPRKSLSQLKFVRVMVQHLAAHEEAVMKDWRGGSKEIRERKQRAAELRKQRREHEEGKRLAKVRQRLSEERLRVTLNKWDKVINAWLHEVAQATWHGKKKRW